MMRIVTLGGLSKKHTKEQTTIEAALMKKNGKSQLFPCIPELFILNGLTLKTLGLAWLKRCPPIELAEKSLNTLTNTELELGE